jgi:hypothetical protein
MAEAISLARIAERYFPGSFDTRIRYFGVSRRNRGRCAKRALRYGGFRQRSGRRWK